MKNQIVIAFCILSLYCCQPADKHNSTINKSGELDTEKIEYDSLTALKYGADDYGMKRYVMAFLKAGPNRTLDSLKALELQKAHLQNIKKMAADKKLVLAGPFLEDGDMRGIYIFDVETLEEAKNLTKSDPAIQAGSLVMELREWYGSAALLGVNEVHQRIEKK